MGHVIEGEEITKDGTAHRNQKMSYLKNEKKSSELFFLHAPDLIKT